MSEIDHEAHEEGEAITAKFAADSLARQQDRTHVEAAELLNEIGERASGPQADDVHDVPDGSTEPPTDAGDSEE